MDISSYEGLQKKIRQLKTPDIEVWENQYADRDYLISLEIPEFTCICPKTGLPDFALIEVEYRPAKACLELKSLKMYTHFYREVGIFHEHLVNKLLDDMVKACQPRWMRVKVEMNPRGGIYTAVEAEYQRKRS
ncbi:MAG: NADPH-dependent 7-cyano-7-deazaguanine reductase QueF [Candidatus Omnitrophica bacterium]|nr:NADPH-dependent 7-cyano-7-deazaguanine reductase QueF [Candidatus Omnitrophota bacterium]